jgi:predicted ATPase/class 3 adenylate cyclase/transcriptional regulator with XRE-family HTH domain
MREGSSFGAWLKRRRKALDLTQADLARLVGCAVVSIRKIEADEQRPSRQMAGRLAVHLQLALEQHEDFIQFARQGNVAPLPEHPLPASAELPGKPAREAPAPGPPRAGGNLPARLASFVGRASEQAELTERPTGTVTFLFTDIEGSTRLWEQQRAAMHKAFPRQEALLRDAMAAHGGYVYKMIGDAFQVAFATANDALAAALEAQSRLAAEDWGALGALRVRMALDSGMAEERADDYVGPLLNRLGRLLAAAHGGQVLLSSAAAELARTNLPPGVTLTALGSYHLKDLQQPEAIYQASVPDLPVAFPPPAGATLIDTAPRRTLPTATTPFVGRSEELDSLVALLVDPQVRLVTVVAPGGMGKTRLALAALERLQRDKRFLHGVAFADLAPLVSAEHLDTTLAAVVGLPLATGQAVTRAPRRQLLDYLREKRLLLALDNCEHLLDGAAELASAILSEAPGVTLLATSRERLELRAERLLPLDGMVTEEDGVALFAATARAVQPAFVLDAASCALVAAICAQVGGMPLAIELAAGWAGTLSLEEIAAELRQGDELLHTGVRDVPERHRSVRSVCDTTWSRLTSQERAVFAQVAVFRGGGTRRALQTVTGASLGQLQTLVGRALLRYDPARERYSVHELLRQYAGQRLAEEPEANEAARDRHAVYNLAMLAEREAVLKGAGQVQALDEIGKDIENVHAAWRWAAETGRGELLGQALDTLGLFCELQGRYTEGLSAFALADVQSKRGSGTASLRALVLAWHSAFARLLGEQQAAQQSIDEALRLAEDTEAGQIDARSQAFVYLQLGHLKSRHDGAVAEQAYRHALERARASGEPWRIAMTLAGLGDLYSELGEFAQATVLLEECLAISRTLGNVTMIATTLAALSQIARFQGRLAENVRLAEESYELFVGLGNRLMTAQGTLMLARAVHWAGEMERAVALLNTVEADFRQLMDQPGLIEVLHQRGGALLALGKYGEAERDLRSCIVYAERLNAQTTIGGCRWMLALSATGRGAYDEAERENATAIAMLERGHQRDWCGRAYTTAATLARIRGRRAEAWGWVKAGLLIGVEHRSVLTTVNAVRAAALLRADMGELERAVELGELARPLFYGKLAEDTVYGPLATLTAALSLERIVAAKERGQQRDLWATGQELLLELEGTG